MSQFEGELIRPEDHRTWDPKASAPVEERAMSRVFVTGSSEGLGLMAGQLLIEQGHKVVLHGRSRERADEAMARAPGAEAAVIGDLSRIREMKAVADQVNRLGRFDAVIHNVGVGYREPRRFETEDRIEHVFAVNVLAPYVLTALIKRPDRLVYLSSGLHHSAEANFDDLLWSKRRGTGRRPIQRASSMMRCSLSRLRGFGRRCAPMRLSRAGWQPGWAVRGPRGT